MELALPVFPSEPWPQAAFVAVCLLIAAGLAMLIFPGTAGRLLGLDSRETRPGGIGEIRPAGGFLAGLSAATLMFDQPVLYAAVGVSLAFATFARLISLMSDTSASLLNILLLLVQAILAGATLYYFFDVVTPELAFAMPTDFQTQLVFYVYATLAVLGFLILFAPRIAMSAGGLWVTAERPGGIASVRSTGGFLMGAGLAGMGTAASLESAPMLFPMLALGMAAALVLAVLGRLLALALNRGNLTFNVIALVITGAAAAILASYISSFI